MIHKNCFPRLAHISLTLTLALAFALPASAAWKEKVLYSFRVDGWISSNRQSDT